MEKNKILLSYSSFNNSFNKKLVFRIGADAGFFSEYNNMVFAILFCLKNKIKFTLSSRKSNFSKIGWSEYFEEFCTQDFNEFHVKFNTREYGTPSLRQVLKRKLRNVMTKTYLTQDLWLDFHNTKFENENFNIDVINLKSDFFGACKYVIDLTWNYNKDTFEKVSEIIKSLNLPKSYLSVHIRQGDKVKESQILSYENYIIKLSEKSENKHFFVLTDDFQIILKLKSSYPKLTFYHLTDLNENGYDHTTFTTLSSDYKKNALLKLFASIEIMAKSELVMCTYNSNVGLFLGMRRGVETTFDVEGKELHIW